MRDAKSDRAFVAFPVAYSRGLLRVSTSGVRATARGWLIENGNLYSITTNPTAIAALFRRMNRYVGNPEPMPGVFPRLSCAGHPQC